MQKLAVENNLSETAFLVKEGDGWRLRWFTPGTEVDLCGHATIASFYCLLKLGIIQEGKTYQFDAMWISSLCDSTAKGKPDIELVDMSSRFRTIDDILEVTTKPIIFDGRFDGHH